MRADTHENLVTLLDLWLSHGTGHLHLVPLSGGDRRVLPVVDGALCRREDWHELQSMLGSHRVELEPGPAEGHGDRRRMGAFLQVSSRRHGVNLSAAYDWTRAGEDTIAASGFHGLDGGGELISVEHLARASAQDPRQQALLEGGRAAIAEEDWAKADRLLSAARDLRMDEPLTLAHLAWARLKNPTLPAKERERDAHAYIRLAGQLAPTNHEVGALLRAVLSSAGGLVAMAAA